MKNPEKMTDQQLTDWATKTATTISKSYWKIGHDRRYDLVDRYHDLKEELQNRNLWEGYCAQTFSCPTHDAYDLTC